eukprot:CAMPEP_0184456992 /NCGR_PEP_ID=MMETSP0740-20130409/28617_1 /TAXON_ID=385413 /ORGANISM="Thalassiosira miniscula, Strain CCMP1093" /LENGTH=83 /DNA_ID=CAMNT_0026829263 /DNA_START=9 /DNA_END=260 /DNA_ORIENTATION=+
MALIQTPVLLYRDPGAIHGGESKPKGSNGAGLIAGKRKFGGQSFSLDQLPAFCRFGFTLFGQVGVPPSCEPVFEVPLALTVTG